MASSSSPLLLRFSSSSLLQDTTSSSDPHHLFPLPIISTGNRSFSPLRASRRFPNKYPQEAVVVVPGARPWIAEEDHSNAGVRRTDSDDEDDEEEEDDDDRSLDLLVRFLQNVFRKVSRRARKAARSVLPPSISTKLVTFSVNGVLILAFLWVLKAFLEVVCTFGSMVFVSILLIRGIWSSISHIKENQYYYTNRTGDDSMAWNGTQAAT